MLPNWEVLGSNPSLVMYSGWTSHYNNNVGCSARLKINFELNPVTEGKQGTFLSFIYFIYNLVGTIFSLLKDMRSCCQMNNNIIDLGSGICVYSSHRLCFSNSNLIKMCVCIRNMNKEIVLSAQCVIVCYSSEQLY